MALMRQVGVKEVNDIVMKSLKQWLVQVAEQARQLAVEGTPEMVFALVAWATLQVELVRNCCMH